MSSTSHTPTKHVDDATATQAPAPAHDASTSAGASEGYLPQADDASYPINHGRPGAAFYAPYTSPPTGAVLKVRLTGGEHAEPLAHERGQDDPQAVRAAHNPGRRVQEPHLGAFEIVARRLLKSGSISPMCQYSAPHNTGTPTEWHLVHQGQFAIRSVTPASKALLIDRSGFALIITEATSVLDNGGITPEDLFFTSESQIPAFKRIVDFHHSQGAIAGIQLAHAGRKSSTPAPWLTDGRASFAPCPS